jgi:hypothetical protein
LQNTQTVSKKIKSTVTGPEINSDFAGEGQQQFTALEAKKNSVAIAREGTILAERSPLAGKVSVNFCG